ncbi:MAG: ComEC/Rec2 family competence protein [Eubacterium sp.]|nr:ComEC/Rec2 family competence protein [Eubacterium sp.]
MRQKLAVAGFSYLCAMIFASVFLSAKIAYGVAAVAVLFAAFLAAIRLKRQTLCLAAISAAIGVTLFCIAYFPIVQHRAYDDGRTYSVDAEIIGCNNLGNDVSSYILKADIDRETVTFLMFGDDVGASCGDRILCDVKFSVIEDSTAFSSGGYYLSQGITLSASPRSQPEYIMNGNSDPLGFLEDYREYIGGRISLLYPDSGGALMQGIFLGDKSEQSYIDKYNIRAAGAAHLTAVSGMHMSLIVCIFASLLELCGLRRFTRLRILLIVAAVGWFMIFFGFTASVMRAGLMLMIHYCGQLLFRKSDCLNSIGAALVIILTFDPLACLDAGLTFSALTAIGAGAVAPELSNRLKKRFKLEKPTALSLCDCLCCCVCASVFAVPLSALYFEMFPVYGVLVSLACIPFFTVSLVCMMLFALTGGMFDVLLAPAHVCCTMMNSIFSFTAGIPFSHISCGELPEKFTVIAGIAVVVTIYIFIEEHRLTATALTCAVAAVIVTASCIIRQITFDGVRIKPFTDGKNGCLLIESTDYCGAVVFGGGTDIAKLLYSTMQGDNIRRLDFLRLMEDNTNSETEYIETFAPFTDRIIYPEYSESLYLGNSYFELDESKLRAVINGCTFSLSHISEKSDTEICFYYGSEKLNGELYGRCFCFDKNQILLHGDDINLYYNETYIEISRDGGSLIKGGGTVNDCR